MLLVWATVVALTGFVGLATMTAATTLPIWIAATRLPEDQPLFIYLVVIAGCIIYWHRANIARMRAGNELRNTHLMLFRPKGSTDSNEHD